jgi:prepilin-type processing-associated H-X9-DG protein
MGQGSVCPDAPLWRTNKDLVAWNGAGVAGFGTVNLAWWSYSDLTIEEVADKPQGVLQTSSYSYNGWLFAGGPQEWFAASELMTNYFFNESAIAFPALTPTTADGIWPALVPAQEMMTVPVDLNHEGNPPPIAGGQGGMWTVLIARHGEHPRPAPHSWPANQKLPGAINVSFFDGHVESVKLYNLWTLKWHKNWVPTGQPGLN